MRMGQKVLDILNETQVFLKVISSELYTLHLMLLQFVDHFQTVKFVVEIKSLSVAPFLQVWIIVTGY